MITCRLPYDLCSQRFHYFNDINQLMVSVGLRTDMVEWFIEYMGKRPRYDINTCPGHIEFYMPNRGLAALFILSWTSKESVMENDPVPRPGGDLC